MQDNKTNKPTGNAIYPSAKTQEKPHYQREAVYKGKDGDSFMQSGVVVLAIVAIAVGAIILTLHYLV
jgi:hypothetical protein